MAADNVTKTISPEIQLSPNSPQRQQSDSEAAHLKRSLGLISSLAVIVGTTIGSGIFISPTGVLQMTGSVGASLLVWFGCGLLSLFGGLCYIELGLLIPKAGGEFVYFHDGLGPLHPFWGPLTAFLFGWMANLVIRPSSTAILALTFANYAVSPFYGSECTIPSSAVTMLAVFVILSVSFVGSYSVKLANGTQNVLTVFKLLALAIVIIVGLIGITRGHYQNLALGFAGSTSSPGDIATAFYRGLWAYDGWNTLNYLTEEVQNPARTLPIAIIAAMIVITVVYLLVNVAYFTVLTPAEMLASPAVAVTLAERSLGAAAFLVPLGVVLSVYGSLNGSTIASARICFSSSREGQFIDSLGTVNQDRRIPSPAVTFHAIIAIIMILATDINSLIDLFSFAIWMFYALCMVTLLLLRQKWPKADRPYRVPTIIPYGMLIISVYLIAAPIIASPEIGYIYVTTFIVVGVLVYYVSIYKRWSPNFMRCVNMSIQIMFNSVCAEFKDEK